MVMVDATKTKCDREGRFLHFAFGSGRNDNKKSRIIHIADMSFRLRP